MPGLCTACATTANASSDMATDGLRAETHDCALVRPLPPGDGTVLDRPHPCRSPLHSGGSEHGRWGHTDLGKSGSPDGHVQKHHDWCMVAIQQGGKTWRRKQGSACPCGRGPPYLAGLQTCVILHKRSQGQPQDGRIWQSMLPLCPTVLQCVVGQRPYQDLASGSYQAGLTGVGKILEELDFSWFKNLSSLGSAVHCFWLQRAWHAA